MRLDVVIPCHGATVAQLEKAATSARRAGEVGRVLVVDDGSPKPLVCRPADEVIRFEENRGPSAARNAGADHSRADWLLFLDSDDTLIHESVGPFLRLCEEVDAVAGVASREIHGAGAMQLKEAPPDWAGKALQSAGDVFRPIELFSASGLLVRGDVFSERGLRFDEDLRIGEDRDFLRRVFEQGPIAVCQSPIVRMHRDGQTLTSPKHLQRRVRDHLILLQRWHGEESEANLREATRWLINACSKHPIPKRTWRDLVQAARVRGWPVPLKCRVRRIFGP